MAECFLIIFRSRPNLSCYVCFSGDDNSCRDNDNTADNDDNGQNNNYRVDHCWYLKHKQVYVQPRLLVSTRHYTHLLLSAGVCYRSIFPVRGALSRPEAVSAVDRRDRRTDGRTDGGLTVS